ncbi:MAG: hypothetical protein WCK76_10350 [Elusimicrobiota bacterium]
MYKYFIVLALAAQPAFAAKAAAVSTEPAAGQLTAAWQRGDFPRVEELAEAELKAGPQSAGTQSLLLLLDHVRGKYESAYQKFGALPKAAKRRNDVLRAVVDSLIHLGRYSEALRIVKKYDFKKSWYRPVLKKLIKKPVELAATAPQVLKFTGGSSLDPYMPAVEGRLTSAAGKVYEGPIRLDTGGEFLHVSGARAEALGLELAACQQGMQAENSTRTCWSQVDLRLGDIVGRNIPVVVIYSLPAGFQPILGTNVLERFKTEIDYPEKQLVLYPAAGAFPPTAKTCRQVPFYMWADHYMFAKGRFGGQRDLNFFVDTGLVAVGRDMRQAAVKVATEDLLAWGIQAPEKIFDPKADIGLGELAQPGLLVIHSPLANVESDLGGVRIHGLLGHAWYKNYLWRIDFEKRQYEFCD